MTDQEQFAIVPAPKGEGFVELSDTAVPARAKGRVFRKQILKYGDLRYKGQKYKVDEKFADDVVRNFNTLGEIVHAPKAGSRNEHTDDPDRNLGEVINVFRNEKGVYADIDVRAEGEADKIGKTLLGVSGLLALNHENRETGERVGPALLHACITNRPYVTGLDDFEEILAMSAEGADISDETLVLTDDETEENTMALTKAELIEALKTEHKLDVVALSAELDELRPLKDEVETLRPQAAGYVALSAKIKDTFEKDDDVIALSAGTEATVENFVETVEKAHDKIVALSAEVGTLNQEKIDAEAVADVEKLSLTGYILPKNKEAMLELRKTNKDLFEKLVPENPVIALSHEAGEEPVEIPGKTYEEEIDRLATLAENTSAAAGH